MRFAFDLERLLLASGVSLLPLYVFASGGVQPAHIVLAFFAGISLTRRGTPQRLWLGLLALLAVYVLFIESIYVAGGKEAGSLMTALYFSYNLIIAAAIYTFCRRNGDGAVALGVFCAALIAVISVASSGVSLYQVQGIDRSIGTFNNPNQLGYFSVCLLSIVYLLFRNNTVSYKFAVLLFATAIFLSIASLSKAAMISVFLVAFFSLKPDKSGKQTGFWLIGILVATLALIVLYQRGILGEFNFVGRLLNIRQESDSSFSERGYFAFLGSSALQLLFGLGKENVLRIVGHETHSTFASIFNAYGLVGFGIFISILLLWARRILSAYGLLGLVCVIGPPMLYGITHNGTRFVFFWVLFATSLATANREIRFKVRDTGSIKSPLF